MNFRLTKPSDWVRFSLVTAAVIYAFFAGLRTVADFDLGWQLATGRYIVQHHVIPSTEMFSYTAHGSPWIYPPFSGVIFYLLFLLGGYAALSWLSAFACAATVLIICGYRKPVGRRAGNRCRSRHCVPNGSASGAFYDRDFRRFSGFAVAAFRGMGRGCGCFLY